MQAVETNKRKIVDTLAVTPAVIKVKKIKLVDEAEEVNDEVVRAEEEIAAILEVADDVAGGGDLPCDVEADDDEDDPHLRASHLANSNRSGFPPGYRDGIGATSVPATGNFNDPSAGLNSGGGGLNSGGRSKNNGNGNGRSTRQPLTMYGAFQMPS